MERVRKKIFILFGIYLILLTWIILFKCQFSLPFLSHSPEINWIPFSKSVIINGKINFFEIVSNVIVFIPVGIYLSMQKPNWSFVKKLCTIFALSLFYEASQFIFAIGACDITDLITNTSGGVIGLLLFFMFTKIFKEKANRILLGLAMIGTVAVIGLATILFLCNR